MEGGARGERGKAIHVFLSALRALENLALFLVTTSGIVEQLHSPYSTFLP